MRVFYLVLGGILLGIAVYHYKHGYVRGWSLMSLLKNPKDWGRNKKTPQHIVCNLNKEYSFLANIGVFQQNHH